MRFSVRAVLGVVLLAALVWSQPFAADSASAAEQTVASASYVDDLAAEAPRVVNLTEIQVSGGARRLEILGRDGGHLIRFNLSPNLGQVLQPSVHRDQSVLRASVQRLDDFTCSTIEVLEISTIEFDGGGNLTRLGVYADMICGGRHTAMSIVIEPAATASPVISPSNLWIGHSFDRRLGVAAFVHNTTDGSRAIEAGWSGELGSTANTCSSTTLLTGASCGSVGTAGTNVFGAIAGEFRASIHGKQLIAELRADRDQTTLAVKHRRIDGKEIHNGFGLPNEFVVEDQVVTIGSQSVSIRFAAPAGELLGVGRHVGATRIDGRGTSPGLEVSLLCGPVTSEFTIHDIAWRPDGSLSRLHMTFEVSCYSGREPTPMSGVVLHNTIDGPPALTISTNTLEPTPIWQPSQENTIFVRNLGPEPALIEAIDIVGDVEFAYMIDSQDCVGELAVNQGCTIDVGFVPFGQAPSGYPGTLRLDAPSWFGPLETRLVGERYRARSGPHFAASKFTDRSGYWTLQADGTVTAFGDARTLLSPNGSSGVIQIVATPQGRGYWTLSQTGHIRTHGDAPDFGMLDRASLAADEQVASMTATPAGDGLWVFTNKGRTLLLGAAPEVGDLTALSLAADVIDSSTSPDGSGVYMLGADGGVFALGGAVFAGSVPEVLPGVALAAPLVGLVPDPDGVGYWLVAADGGVFAFDAPFRGSIPGVLPPGTQLDAAIVAMVPYGNGYLLLGADGGVFNFSNRPFAGSLGGTEVESPVVSIAALPAMDPYVDATRSVR